MALKPGKISMQKHAVTASLKKSKYGKQDNGFYGHMTHASMQSNEDSVDYLGSVEDNQLKAKATGIDGFYKDNGTEIF